MACDDTIPAEYWLTDPLSLIHATTLEELEGLRADVIGFLWKGAGLPTRLPDAVTEGVASPLTDVPNLDRCDRLRVDIPDGVGTTFVSTNYLLRPLSANGKAAVVHHGHAHDLDSLGVGDLIRALVSDGVAVVSMWMPGYGPNTPAQNGPVTHQYMADYETLTFCALRPFLEPVIVCWNHVEQTVNPTCRLMTGLSGGGWTSTLIGALDTRFDLTCEIAGSYPHYLRTGDCGQKSIGDWEQMGGTTPPYPGIGPLYNDVSYLDLYLLACTGGRQRVQFLNRTDTSCFDGPHWQTYEPRLQEYAQKFGGKCSVFQYTLNDHAVTPLIIQEIRRRF